MLDRALTNFFRFVPALFAMQPIGGHLLQVGHPARILTPESSFARLVPGEKVTSSAELGKAGGQKLGNA
jgi:hypothetical protein